MSNYSSSSGVVVSGGVFATEPGQRLVHILESVAKRGFQGLYDKCVSNVQGNYYQTGLRRVHLWSDDVIADDLEAVRATCPDLDDTFEACFVEYVSDRYRGRQRPTVQCPSVAVFARRFLESLGQHDALVSGDYFERRDPIVRRMACVDSARQALYTLVNANSVRVELASEYGSVVSRNLADTTAAELERQVTPADSVSQVSGPPPSRVPAPHLPPPTGRAAPSVVSRTPSTRDGKDPPPPPPPHRTPSVVSTRDAQEGGEQARPTQAPHVRAPSVVSRAPSTRDEQDPPLPTPRAPSVVSRAPSTRDEQDPPLPTPHAPSVVSRAPSAVSRARMQYAESRAHPPSPVDEGRVEGGESPPPVDADTYREGGHGYATGPASPVRGVKPPSVASRHDFTLLTADECDAVALSPPKRAAPRATSHASSRDSSVSIGMKKVRSPRN